MEDMIERNSPEISDADAVIALERCIAQVRRNIPDFLTVSQNHSSVHNVYPSCANEQWTCGFWPGELWLAFLLTGKAEFKDAGREHVHSMAHRIQHKIAVDHHDMGFLYSPSCVAAWKLARDDEARNAALLAADQLISRFQEKGGFLQAWGAMGTPENYRFIIDCLLNTPLLYWATQETGDAKYADIARKHTATCMRHSIRADGSTYHTFFMDSATGEPIRGETCQGYANDSVWARGQAWAVYGTALACRHDFHEEYRDAFSKTSSFFLSRLPYDNVPYWDMIFTDATARQSLVWEPRDSSSASIVACAMLEMASQLQAKGTVAETGGLTSADCKHIARVLLKSLADDYAVRLDTPSNGLVLHGTYSKKSPYNTCTQEGVDECVSWGDYFYMEALTRLMYPAWKSFW